MLWVSAKPKHWYLQHVFFLGGEKWLVVSAVCQKGGEKKLDYWYKLCSCEGPMIPFVQKNKIAKIIHSCATCNRQISPFPCWQQCPHTMHHTAGPSRWELWHCAANMHTGNANYLVDLSHECWGLSKLLEPCNQSSCWCQLRCGSAPKWFGNSYEKRRKIVVQIWGKGS